MLRRRIHRSHATAWAILNNIRQKSAGQGQQWQKFTIIIETSPSNSRRLPIFSFQPFGRSLRGFPRSGTTGTLLKPDAKHACGKSFGGWYIVFLPMTETGCRMKVCSVENVSSADRKRQSRHQAKVVTHRKAVSRISATKLKIFGIIQNTLTT